MRINIILLLTLLFDFQAIAQDNLWEIDYSDYLPIVREGVQWVNEKVVINQGDTTHYYYKYEFCGKDTDTLYMNFALQVNNACYYYTGRELDTAQDSLIAGLRDNGEVTCFRNNAYEKVTSEGRAFCLDMYLDGGTRILYGFFHPLWYDNCVEYYLSCQDLAVDIFGIEPSYFLTETNFIEIEPITIEGKSCSRCAYIGEEGDTLAYVVEGIGFDSRDMGDLLTPFTRKPDPTADYQECWGLSHVVKDGKIIYKGMRYRHGAFDAIDEVVADQMRYPTDPHYYNLMGQPVGTEVPTAPGIYIHKGKKIIVR